MNDKIISERSGEVYAEIDFQPHATIDYLFCGVVLSDRFPPRIKFLIDEMDSMIRACSISLLDELEKEFYGHELALQKINKRIFNVSLGDGGKIEFFTKYPSMNGYLEKYPDL